jgi:hypothetical protein
MSNEEEHKIDNERAIAFYKFFIGLNNRTNIELKGQLKPCKNRKENRNENNV